MEGENASTEGRVLRTYRLKLSYDGTRYRGWQRLVGEDRTVQGRVEAALSEIFGAPIEIDGSGRTDAGVHAAGQVASFRAEERSPKSVLAQLRHLLPEDIGALTLEYAPDRFHARLSATEKTYVYRVRNSETPDVFSRRYCAQVAQPLDIHAMREAAALLVGTHDFTSFCGNRHLKKSPVRTLHRLDIDREGEEIRFSLTADGFLQHMVRILVGTLLEIGMGKRAADSIPALFAARERALAGETAPAKGLCLMEVRYE